MLGSDPAIDARSALSARAFQAVFPLIRRLRYSSPALQFATKPIAKPTTLTIPTRHGAIRTLLHTPTDHNIAAALASGRRPPLHLITHGGGFIIRVPEQEDNVARYIASELGAYVAVPDFDTAPQVRHPVSEHQAYDTYTWLLANADRHDWDRDRVSIGGASAGSQVAFGVVIQALEAGDRVPPALTSEFGTCDIGRPNELRTSPKKRPVVGTALMNLVRSTYFVGTDLTDPLVSPRYYRRLAEFPPTLILTGGLDTLRHEMNELAADIAAKGVRVTHQEFAGVDHGFTHAKPVEVAREAIRMIGEHVRTAYATRLLEQSS